MDILRKELEAFYLSQKLSDETLDAAQIPAAAERARSLADVIGGCAVVTDAASDRCLVHVSRMGPLMGICEMSPSEFELDSSDEDLIYARIHPEDLVDKRLLEYEYFKSIDLLTPPQKVCHIAKCNIRMRTAAGEYVRVDNTTQALRLSPGGKVWLILCTYALSASAPAAAGIAPTIINTSDGAVRALLLGAQRDKILSDREKQVLELIKAGRPSKQIADMLGISVNTVSRHRQNILRKLSVANSAEAVAAATLMRLL